MQHIYGNHRQTTNERHEFSVNVPFSTNVFPAGLFPYDFSLLGLFPANQSPLCFSPTVFPRQAFSTTVLSPPVFSPQLFKQGYQLMEIL